MTTKTEIAATGAFILVFTEILFRLLRWAKRKDHEDREREKAAGRDWRK